MTVKTPTQLINLYWTEVWNNQRTDLIPELCADPMIRHEANKTVALSVEDQIKRIDELSDQTHPFFEHKVLLSDENHVGSVWNMYSRKGEPMTLCGIEVFKVVDGKLAETWNSHFVSGSWGEPDSDQ